jgi:hypothetical protein
MQASFNVEAARESTGLLQDKQQRHLARSAVLKPYVPDYVLHLDTQGPGTVLASILRSLTGPHAIPFRIA